MQEAQACPGTYPRFIFLDTNIYSRICKNEADHLGARSYIDKCKLTVMVTGHLIAELYRANQQHAGIAKFFKEVDAWLVEPHTQCLQKDLAAYPRRHLGFPQVWCTFRDHDEADILSLLGGSDAARMDASLRECAAEVPARFRSLKDNFPPDKNVGSYTDAQATEFADLWIMDDLRRTFPNDPHLTRLRKPLTELSFPSARLHTMLLYWKFYRGKRVPKQGSDLGDRAHAAFFPFCKELVLENDQANVVRQVQRKFPELFLAACNVYTMKEFFQRVHGDRG